LGLVILGAPILGMTYVAALGAARLAHAARRWHRTRPILTTTAALVLSGALVAQLGLVWPQTFESALHHAEFDQPAAQSAASPPATTAPTRATAPTLVTEPAAQPAPPAT